MFLPGLNEGILAAGILIVLPVCGLRPVLADRARTEKVPKPTNGTSFPRYRATGFELTHAGAFSDVVSRSPFAVCRLPISGVVISPAQCFFRCTSGDTYNRSQWD